jgi:hypothetical protein
VALLTIENVISQLLSLVDAQPDGAFSELYTVNPQSSSVGTALSSFITLLAALGEQWCSVLLRAESAQVRHFPPARELFSGAVEALGITFSARGAMQSVRMMTAMLRVPTKGATLASTLGSTGAAIALATQQPELNGIDAGRFALLLSMFTPKRNLPQVSLIVRSLYTFYIFRRQ